MVEATYRDQPLVMVIDDVSTNLRILESIFRKEGFCTLTAREGPEGRALARSRQPDLILLDVDMPEEDGFETCRKLKQDPATADIPVIFISALRETGSKVSGFEAGAVDYITKPFDDAEVLARTRVHINLRRAHQLLVDEQRRRLDQFRDAQQAILTRPEDLPEAHFAVYFRPLQEAGGDFWDVVEVGDGIHVYFVADISGHSVGASFPTAALKALLKQHCGPLSTPGETMRVISDVMRSILAEGQYLTAFYARLYRKRAWLQFAGGGHPPAIRVTRGGEVGILHSPGDVLGVFDAVVFEPSAVSVAPGDRLFLFTDGLIEGAAGGERSQENGLRLLGEAGLATLDFPLAAAVEAMAKMLIPDPAKAEDDLLLLGVEA